MPKSERRGPTKAAGEARPTKLTGSRELKFAARTGCIDLRREYGVQPRFLTVAVLTGSRELKFAARTGCIDLPYEYGVQPRFLTVAVLTGSRELKFAARQIQLKVLLSENPRERKLADCSAPDLLG